MDRILDLKRPKTVRSGEESDARTRRTPNPLCAKSTTAAPLQHPCEKLRRFTRVPKPWQQKS